MNYAEIRDHDIANGEGFRVSLFVSGCRNHCKGCFNQVTWDFNYGKPFTEETINKILEYLKPEHISGLSILGGEPFEPENQCELIKLIRKVKEVYPKKSIWMYTGYVLENNLLYGCNRHTKDTDEILRNIDVLIDGPYKEELRDISLKFRGSKNQRILKISKNFLDSLKNM